MQKFSNHSCPFSAAHLLIFPDRKEGRTTWSSLPAHRILAEISSAKKLGDEVLNCIIFP